MNKPRSNKEQELSYILLIELLAHQFCFPVRWIETQDFVLHEHQTEKIVEVGPSNTLINMAKRTRDLKYQTHDMANSVHREFLSSKIDMEHICYAASSVKSQIEEPKKDVGVVHPVAKSVPVESPVTASAVPSPPQLQLVENVPDVPIVASAIVKAMVSNALKKDLDDVLFSSTIKSLTGGRSTMQNEIISNLDNEFGTLPDGPEDMGLDKLSASLQTTFSGQLGRFSKIMIDKMITSKMPGSFGLTSLREYLKNEWGFERGRQDAILVSAINLQPTSRLDTEESARRFWATICEKYVQEQNLNLSPSSSKSVAGSNSERKLDPAELTSLRKSQRTLYQQLINVLTKQMNVDSQAGSGETTKLRQDLENLQEALDVWIVEHGSEYATGIKPMFDVRKVRVFDSSWNWALQYLLVIYHDLITGRIRLGDEELLQLRSRLLNRSTPRLISMMRFLLSEDLLEKSEYGLAVKNWLLELVEEGQKALLGVPMIQELNVTTGPKTEIQPNGVIKYVEVKRADGINPFHTYGFDKFETQITSIQVASDSDTPSTASNTPGLPHEINVQLENYLAIETKHGGLWRTSMFLTDEYLRTLDALRSTGLSFHKRNILITGAGKGSIGFAILQRLLSGGARVIVTTSSFSPKVVKRFQDVFVQFGARDSRLMVLPFNQGSRQDIEALVNYIYSLGDNEWDLDHIIPFAAISEHSLGIDDINSNTELAHRLMLTNTMRLIGAVKRHKAARGIDTRPAQVILPLSPNHGIFGNDGLYSESKLGLESLLQKWHSEDWGDYLSICGTVIGWTRGTSLMSDNDIVSEGIENLGVRTFSQHEMALNILGLMTSAVLEASQLEPVVADLSGGMGAISDLKEQVIRIRGQISDTSAERRALSLEVAAIQERSLHAPKRDASVPFATRANIKFDFPRLPDYDTDIQSLNDLQGMVDLERVVVVTGFAEVGPYGNARTRWEMEAHGQFSLEGCIEMAWIMGLIEQRTIDAKSYTGWVDKETGEPIDDMDIKTKYEQQILEHTGIRLIEARTGDGIEPKIKQFLHEVAIQEDFGPFEASNEVAQDFIREHGENVKVTQIKDSDQFQVQFKKGTTLLIPKALQVDGFVGGQVPTGWSAETYGISKDIIDHVDPATLYALVCTVEALLSAGITDPYEFYKYIHVSELGICVGSGLGGIISSQNILKERFLNKSVEKDVLAESFINTGSAWINMLLLSSSGPNITPVGACATSIESMSVGHDLITSGKAKVVLVGGYDFITKDISYEFSNMKATTVAENEIASGRSPKEMSRPTTSTRSGFVESEGCGIQVLTTAKLALDMGLPIHGIVSMAQTAFDKAGNSLPAPGRGILTMSRETHTALDPPLMNMAYRKRCIALRIQQAKEMEASELAYLQAELATYTASDVDFDISIYQKQRLDAIFAETQREVKETLNTYGNEFWKTDNRISPIRGALATWGLTIDDLTVASFHGTSTVKNDDNESEVIQTQLSHLGRKPGNPILSVCQKYLTGHPKGAAGAWMFNGCLQILDTGLVPGNRNADNIDADLEKYDLIVFPNQNIQLAEGVKAFSVSSFGFGQKGAQTIGIHPKYLFAALDKDTYRTYCAKVQKRQKSAYRYFHDALSTKSMFVAKKTAPYPKEMETGFLCNPDARLPMGKDSHENEMRKQLLTRVRKFNFRAMKTRQ